MERKKIIIDCDPGIDDAIALLYGFEDKNFDIRLISTVSGNVRVERTTTNAIGIAKLADFDTSKIVMGSRRPLVDKPRFAEDIHGVSGLGKFEFKDIDLAPYENDDVVARLYEAIMESDEKVYLVPIGPFTNIARLFLLYPEVKDNIEGIYLMGGGLKGGNISMAAEFNVAVDPEAAYVLFTSGLKIVMAGLDVTEKALLYPDQLEYLKNNSKYGQFIEDIVLGNPRPQVDESLMQMNDVIALMAITHPEIFTIEELYVEVELFGTATRGLTFGDQRRVNRAAGNTFVITDLDYDKFIELLLERLC